MKKTHLLLAAVMAAAMVGGVGSKALLQPLPPSAPPEGKPSLPNPEPREKPVAPQGTPALPQETPALPQETPVAPKGTPAIPNQEALVEMASNLVVEKFQNASCEDLSGMFSQDDKSSQAEGGQQAEMQKKAIALLKQKPEVREQFLNRVAPAIANKMFDCNLIP